MEVQMKRKVTILALAAVLATGSLALITLATPQDVDAIGGCRCLAQQTTAQVIGFGNGSCAAAQADLLNKLLAAAGCDSFCSYSVVYTNACYQDEPNAPTWYKSKGYLQYQCEVCLELPPL